MGGFASGVADAMQDLQSQKAASDAANANRRAEDAEAGLRSAKSRADTMVQGALAWKNRADELLAMQRQATSELSGCLMVINAMIKTMHEDMSPMEREKFRDRLAQRARQRILEVDAANRGKPNFLNIENSFKQLPENKQLGVV